MHLCRLPHGVSWLSLPLVPWLRCRFLNWLQPKPKLVRSQHANPQRLRPSWSNWLRAGPEALDPSWAPRAQGPWTRAGPQGPGALGASGEGPRGLGPEPGPKGLRPWAQAGPQGPRALDPSQAPRARGLGPKPGPKGQGPWAAQLATARGQDVATESWHPGLASQPAIVDDRSRSQQEGGYRRFACNASIRWVRKLFEKPSWYQCPGYAATRRRPIRDDLYEILKTES